MAYLIFALLCAIWGSSFILMKKASLAFGPVSIAGIRCGLAALVVLALLLILRPGNRARWRDAPRLVVVSALGYGIPYAIQPYLIARHGSGFIGMMICCVPLLTILFSIAVLRIYASRRQWIGVLVGLACMGLVFADGLQRNVPVGHLLLALLVPACYALGNTLVKRWFASASPVFLTAVGTGIAAAALLPLGLSTEPLRTGSHLTLAAISLLVLGLLGTGLAVYLFYKLILDQGPLFAGMVTYLIPFGALLWGWVDAERVSLLQVVALSGVLSMVAVVQSDIQKERKQGDADQQGAADAEPAQSSRLDR